MTLEEVCGHESSTDSMCSAGKALEELLVSSRQQNCLTVGVYESAKVMNVDPDSVAVCVLATDEQYEWDIALQIHFTLIQAFCFDNDINIVRVNHVERLTHIVCNANDDDSAADSADTHCILVTRSNPDSLKDSALEKLGVFCEERRAVCEWVPTVTLPER